jgi:hypothetical protein
MKLGAVTLGGTCLYAFSANGASPMEAWGIAQDTGPNLRIALKVRLNAAE